MLAPSELKSLAQRKETPPPVSEESTTPVDTSNPSKL